VRKNEISQRGPGHETCSCLRWFRNIAQSTFLFDQYWSTAVSGLSDLSAAAKRKSAKANRPKKNGNDNDDNEKNGEKEEGPDTEHIFGFTEGTDIGEAGEKEFEVDSISRIGKRAGSYFANSTKFEFDYTATRHVKLSLGAIVGRHHISAVPDLDDINRSSIEGLSFEAKFRLIERSISSPVGLSLSIEPSWLRVDETSGQRASKQSIEAKLAADTELVKDKLFAAVNVLYEPERERLRGEVEKESTLGFSGALAFQVAKGTFFGGEVRYFS
jgi:hypothetical protein